VFSTAADNQTSVEIHVLQGERPMAGDNKSIGRFILDGILPAPRGLPQIEVAFDIDANGILSVSAKDKATGREQRITITASSGLNKDEIENMTREAESHAEEDRRRRDEIELRNSADSLAYAAEKILREDEGKLPEALKDELREKISGVRGALERGDLTEVRSSVEALNQSLQKLGSAVYGQGGTAEGGPPKGDEGTVEGEFREV
jgi:molecular chaperone DnaK